MASWFYGINRGDKMSPEYVAVGTSTTGKDIELRVDQTVAKKMDVMLALDVFEQFIPQNGVGTTTGPGVDLPKL